MDRIITTSEISTLFMCPRKHELQYVRRLVPRRRVIFLDESIAAHHAMEQFYKGASLEKSIGAFDRVYDGHINALVRQGHKVLDAAQAINPLLESLVIQHRSQQSRSFRRVEFVIHERIQTVVGGVFPRHLTLHTDETE